MLKKLVTIVVPCKNEEDYIGRLLHSLSEQACIDGVRIIIADKSDDNTRTWIHHYGIEYNLNYEISCKTFNGQHVGGERLRS